jgi:hypothetical protein
LNRSSLAGFHPLGDMKPCKSFWQADSFAFMGLVGLAITIALNLVALLLLKKAEAEYFSGKWWSVWFPSYTVWLTFTVISVACFCYRKPRERRTVKRGLK